jgi:hypothetical protein
MALQGMPPDELLAALRNGRLSGQPENVEEFQGSLMRNALNAIDMMDLRVLPYRGRQFLVPPVPAPVGWRLDDVRQRLDWLSKEPVTPDNRLEHYQRRLDLFIEALNLFGTLVRPLTVLDRLTWRWQLRYRPPFRYPSDPNDREFADLMGFFWLCRMRSSIRRNFELMQQSTGNEN